MSMLQLVLLAAVYCQLLGLPSAARTPEATKYVGDGSSSFQRPAQGRIVEGGSIHGTHPTLHVQPQRLPSGLNTASNSAQQQHGRLGQTTHAEARGLHGSTNAFNSGPVTLGDHSRRLQQFGPMYTGLPGDLDSLESILAAARDAFTFLEPHTFPAPVRQQHGPRSRSLGRYDQKAGPDEVPLSITFQSAHPDVEVGLHLPGSPRSFNVTAQPLNSTGPQDVCTHTKVPYANQDLLCSGMIPGSKWLVELVDADSDNLVLASKNFTVTSGMQALDVPVELGLLSVEAAFDQLAWAGMVFPRPRHSSITTPIHAQIVGAQVVIYTRQGGQEVIWDMQWTGSEGTTTFFLVPGARGVYYANMSVGDTVLRSTPITLDEPLYYQDLNNGADSVSQIQQQQLVADPQLLCTGEIVDVRGSAGTFPQSIDSQQRIYHPKGFTCHWDLQPDAPDILLSVDYRGLLPDESITLELAPNNVVQLRPPDGGPGAVFQASLWVEESVLVSFQTTRSSSSRVGAFSISWTSVSSSNKSVLDGKTMVVVLSCVSAAGAVLAACCFYFVCCSRRRRAGAVVMDGDDGPRRGGVQLVRVPSAVRELLPCKPYNAPEANPLPGAAVEPDCCAICLVELEPGEHVTVLPCMHFYHKDCIGSWLKRNCTCPLCKNNVLEAFKVQQYEALQALRNQERLPSSSPLAATPVPTAPGRSSPALSSSGGSASRQSQAADSEAAGPAGLERQQQQQVELTTMHHAGSAAGRALDRTPSPWAPLDRFRAPSPAVAALPGHPGGSAAEPLTPVSGHAALPRAGRLAPLPQLQVGPQATATVPVSSSGSSWATTRGSSPVQPVAQAAAVPPLVIPPSPSPSVISMQSGSVLATPEDFAPAAAAAAAVLAGMASRQRSLSPSGVADAAAAAAQASVTALRSSSRGLGRRLQVMLSPTAAAAGSSSARAGGVQGRQGSSVAPQVAAVAGPPLANTLGPRVAVSIYAYAGSPSGTEDEEAPPAVQQQQQPALDNAAGGERRASHHAVTVLSLPGAVDSNMETQHHQMQPPPPQQQQQQRHENERPMAR